MALGFKMKHIAKYAQEPLDASPNWLHINPLEFLAVIVNMWLVVKLIMSLPPVRTGLRQPCHGCASRPKLGNLVCNR